MNKNLQQYITLDQSYFFDIDEVYCGSEIIVQRLVNYDLYQKIHSEECKNYTQQELCECYDKAIQTEQVVLDKGGYIIDNSFFYGEFCVGDLGLLDGECKLRSKVNKSIFDLTFIKGVAVKGCVKEQEVVISRFYLEDRIFTVEGFKLGRLVTKQVVHFDLEIDKNTIFYSYYEDESIESIENNINQTHKVYYHNGHIQRIKDILNERTQFFNNKGVLTEEFFVEKGYRCSLTYQDGVLTDKTCIGEEDEYFYFYKEGKLDFYEVLDKATDTTSVYKSSGELVQQDSLIQLGFTS
ncbi:hypothetical protein ACF8C4_14770 [Myroides odoratimimus]|uniref:Uncharacterized protein n=1 Tax=Myroides odoratimimus CIP 101113 TaxID=883154 RepID=A0AAV3F1N6_9FLAO|nr:hypothetical protein [Myroides odoratimimus]EHO09792.1 hypothetical protein HMPREF9715_02345 [Myroides odoratimimus CIP 101113]MDM1457351.1 hypothetical protein [Myroides odoratimimus]